MNLADKDPELPKNLMAGHAYEVTEVDDRGRIRLWNPHNVRILDPEILTVGEFKKHLKNRYTTLE